MPIGPTSAPTAIIDHINRVSDPIWTSCCVAYTWPFDILQEQRQTHYLFEHNVTDHGRISFIWQFKEVCVLAWTNRICGTFCFQRGDESQSKRWKQFQSGQNYSIKLGVKSSWA